MSKILKNNTLSSISVNDVGITINASGQYTIPPQDYLLWAASSNAVTKIGDGDIIVNDGTSDLSISDGIDLIKGIFTKSVSLTVGSTSIGSSGDRLKVDSLESEVASFVINSITTPIANNKSMLALYNGSVSNVLKIKSIKIINNQTTVITGVIVDFRFKRITGLTGGITLTPYPYDTNDTIASGIISSTTGTVSGESAYDLKRVVYSSDEWGVGTQDVESLQNIMQQLLSVYEKNPGQKPLTLRPGQGISIKCITNSTQGNFDIIVEFTQE